MGITVTHTHSHFLVVEQHAIDLLYGHVSRLLRLKVHKTIAFGVALVIKVHLAASTVGDHRERQTGSCTYLAGQDIAKGTEGVVQSLVVNGAVEVLDEDVPHSRATQRGVTLGPHDAHRTTLQDVKVHRVKSTFSWGRGGGG